MKDLDLAAAPLSAYRRAERPAPGPGGASLVLLHGTGGSAEDMLSLGAAVAPNAALYSLEGDVNEGGARRFFRRKAEGVYDMADLAARTAALDAHLSALLADHERDPALAAGLGYSNGANILANLMFRAPKRLARWALLRPLIPFEPPQVDLTGAKVLIAAGHGDPIAPVSASERLASQLEERGAEVTLRWSMSGHQLDQGDLEATARLLAADGR